MAVRVYAEGDCPRCSSTLYTNGRTIFCARVGCSYGIDSLVPLPEPTPAAPSCRDCHDWGCRKCLEEVPPYTEASA